MTYESLISANRLQQLHHLATNHFQQFDPQTKTTYYATFPAGYEACLCVDASHQHIVYNNYDHPLGQPDHDIILTDLQQSADQIVQTWRNFVIDHDLDVKNQNRLIQLQNLTHSDLVAFD